MPTAPDARAQRRLRALMQPRDPTTGRFLQADRDDEPGGFAIGFWLGLVAGFIVMIVMRGIYG